MAIYRPSPSYIGEFRLGVVTQTFGFVISTYKAFNANKLHHLNFMIMGFTCNFFKLIHSKTTKRIELELFSISKRLLSKAVQMN